MSVFLRALTLLHDPVGLLVAEPAHPELVYVPIAGGKVVPGGAHEHAGVDALEPGGDQAGDGHGGGGGQEIIQGRQGHSVPLH